MTTYVLDTNIISFYLKGNETVGNNITSALLDEDAIVVAPIAYYEVKRGLMAVGARKQLKEFDDFCTLFGVGEFDNSVLDVAAAIYAGQRKAGHVMEDADIFIAAFCKNRNFTLVTNNTKHFEHIPELKLVDWTLVYKEE
jgi:predicted nucleic acid-binding protein